MSVRAIITDEDIKRGRRRDGLCEVGIEGHHEAQEPPCWPCRQIDRVYRRQLRARAQIEALPKVLRRHPELHHAKWLPGVDILHAVTENV